MKRRSLQIKAAFLMIVFSLNTIIGFACAIGINMGFNTTHHHDEVMETVHVHKDGKKHIHHETAKHHGGHKKDQHESKTTKDNCCNEKVLKFNEIDKSFSHSFNSGLLQIFNTTFVSSFFHIADLYASYINTDSKYFVRSYHPPIPDIRIKIQSFQI